MTRQELDAIIETAENTNEVVNDIITYIKEHIPQGEIATIDNLTPTGIYIEMVKDGYCYYKNISKTLSYCCKLEHLDAPELLTILKRLK